MFFFQFHYFYKFRWIVSAAHCFLERGNYSVQLGTATDGGAILNIPIDIRDIHPHPNYKEGVISYDIGS